jgi:ADP-ribose pyrophosphatase
MMAASRRVFETPWFSIDEFALPDGAPFFRLTRPDGVVILALTGGGEIVLVRQFRPARSRFSLEMPAGSIDPGEAPLEAAKRELLEETGYDGGDWSELGIGGMSLDRDSATMHLFLARDVSPASAPEANVEVVVVPASAMADLFLSGECEQLAALSALVLARWKGLGDLGRQETDS